MELTLKVVWTDPTVMEKYRFALTGLTHSVQEIFERESSNKIKLRAQRIEVPYLDTPQREIPLSTLIAMGNYYVPNVESVQASTYSKEILIIIGTSFKQKPNYKGVMFDSGLYDNNIQFYKGTNGRPRECCCVFTDPINKFGLANNLRVERLVSRTLVHELGHVFNLRHPKTGEPASLMSTTKLGLPNRAYTSFTEKDRKRLHLIEEYDYRPHQPGTSEFGSYSLT